MAIVGGSLGGLITALVLRDVGCDVEVFERSSVPLEGRGAGIVLHPVTARYFVDHRLLELDRVSASATTLRYVTSRGDVLLEEPIRYRFTSFATLYGALASGLEPERHHLGSDCVGLVERDDVVELRLAGGRAWRSDLVVGADGIGSTVRALLFPEVEPVYGGYVAWRGTHHEMPAASRERLDGVIAYYIGPRTHILSYPIPGAHPADPPLVNWVWYRNVAGGSVLEEFLVDRVGHTHHMSLPPGSVRDGTLDELREEAVRSLPPPFAELVRATLEPFVQVVFDIAVPRMASRRVCLVGDAAFTLRPHIAAATAKAAENAHALAAAIADSPGDVPGALARWEPAQLALGRQALERARDVGDRVQFAGTFRPGDPSVAFGLHRPGDQSFPAG